MRITPSVVVFILKEYQADLLKQELPKITALARPMLTTLAAVNLEALSEFLTSEFKECIGTATTTPTGVLNISACPHNSKPERNGFSQEIWQYLNAFNHQYLTPSIMDQDFSVSTDPEVRKKFFQKVLKHNPVYYDWGKQDFAAFVNSYERWASRTSPALRHFASLIRSDHVFSSILLEPGVAIPEFSVQDIMNAGRTQGLLYSGVFLGSESAVLSSGYFNFESELRHVRAERSLTRLFFEEASGSYTKTVTGNLPAGYYNKEVLNVSSPRRLDLTAAVRNRISAVAKATTAEFSLEVPPMWDVLRSSTKRDALIHEMKLCSTTDVLKARYPLFKKYILQVEALADICL